MRAASLHDFTAAALPDPWTVLGRRLRPFCLGHALALERLRNPLYVGGSTPTRGHLLSAILICSSPAGWQGLNRSLTWYERWWLFRAQLTLRLAPRLVLLKAALLRGYMEAATETIPERWEPAEEGAHPAPSAVPPMVGLWLDLRAAGYSDTEALNLPLGLALWLTLASAAESGRVDLVTEHDTRLAELAATLASAN